MSTQDIVQKLWNLCNVLRDDGITYHQYVTELTYILFLKMANETTVTIPLEEYIELRRKAEENLYLATQLGNFENKLWEFDSRLRDLERKVASNA